MKPIFASGPALQWRLLLAVIAAIALIMVDSRTSVFTPYRTALNSIVTPVQWLANLPPAMMDEVAKNVTTHSELMQRKHELELQLFAVRAQLLRIEHLEQENARLRKLLDSPVRAETRRMVAELLAVDSDPFSHLVVINKGALDGVFEGQPVLNDLGVVGQVVNVGPTSSRVLLITDASHAIPVRVVRNDIRAIAAGRGDLDELELPYIPGSTDLQVGDQLLTSGLGGRFPEGYPVAEITKFEYRQGLPYAIVRAKPKVALDRLRYLLLVWPEVSVEPQALASGAVATQNASDATATQEVVDEQ